MVEARKWWQTLAYLRQIFQEWDKVEQLCVVHVVEPRVDRDSIFGMKHVGGGRIIDDNDTLERAANSTEVLTAKLARVPSAQHR